MEIPENSLAGLDWDGSLAVTDWPTALPAGTWTFAPETEPVNELTIIAERLGFSLSMPQVAKSGGYQLEEDEEPCHSCDQFTGSIGDR